jgi:S-ribosylhomocysteine lyase
MLKQKETEMDKLIASFQVDHTRIGYGIFVSRRDVVNGAYITTFDIRMKRPNVEPAVHPNAMHTIEHIVATYLRNSKFRDHVVYW